MKNYIVSKNTEYNFTDNLIDVNENDFISSDDLDSNECTVNKPKKYNQLKPKADFIFKLLQSFKSKNGSIWKTANFTDNVELLNNSELNEDIHTVLSVKMAKSNNKRKREDVSLEEDGLYVKMAKSSKKRKCEDVSLDDNVSKNVKKSRKRDFNVLIHKSKDHKMQSHRLSSSDEEINNASMDKQMHRNINENNIHNGQMSRLETVNLQENVTQLSEDTEAQVNGKCDEHYSSESYQTSDNETKQNNHRKPSKSYKEMLPKKTSQLHDKKNCQEKVKMSREHSFTIEDEEGISHFSPLLSDKLIEKNNIWVLQCPTAMDCSSLTNQYLDLSGRCILDDGATTFEAYSHRKAQNSVVTLAIPSERNHFKLCEIPITGNIVVEKSVEIENHIDFTIPEPPEYVNLPGNLRERHPLLGKDYENQPVTSARAQNIVKKKRRSKKFDESVNDVPNQEINDSYVEHSKKKKKKRHKSSEDLADNGYQKVLGLEESYEEQKVKRKKKKKHHDDDSFS